MDTYGRLMIGPVDPDAYGLVWHQVARMLLAGIADGTYPPGTRLPSENDIAQAAGVARLTARRAFTWLTEQGIAQAFPGRGTFVRPVLPDPLPMPPDGRPL